MTRATPIRAKTEPTTSGRLAFTLFKNSNAKIIVTKGVVQTMKLTSFTTANFNANSLLRSKESYRRYLIKTLLARLSANRRTVSWEK